MGRQEKTVIFDLTAGPQSLSKQAVMDVVATKSQLLYLRGQAFDSYEGKRWVASDGEERWLAQEGETNTVHISARMVLPIQYVPYYASVELDMGVVQNPQQLQTYTYSQSQNATASDDLLGNCLQLPATTKAWAEETLQGIFGADALTASERAMRIQTFVRGCAEYDANPPAMPENGDFAQWFAEERDGGYCVHFATLAAVLLRGAGISARFVTGYTVDVQAGVRKTVTGEDAHAWVEYFDGVAWRILEATPTAQEIPLQEISLQEEKHRNHPVLWGIVILALVAMEIGRWRHKKDAENPRLIELRQKAAFSRDGLNEEEKEEYEALVKAKLCLPL